MEGPHSTQHYQMANGAALFVGNNKTNFMARAKRKIARFDRYKNGEVVKDTSTKKGFRIDYSKPRDEHDVIIVKKGNPYWSWKFRFGPTIISNTPPTRSQLTQSEFLSALYDIEDELQEITDIDDLEGIKERIEELRDEQEEKKANMPEGLQEGPVGELLQERYDALDSWVTELEAIETDIDEDEIREGLENPDDDEEFEEAKQEKIDEILEEIRGCEYEG